MRIALLCATRRGLAVLKKLTDLVPDWDLAVFSFREEPGEPLFFEQIRECTLARKGSFFETRQLTAASLKPFWEDATVDLMLVVSWRFLIPMEVYKKPRLGAFVFHDSLLPAYRGFSPTVWSIINGEDHTGVTLFEIADGIDTGDIVDQERVEIASDETIASMVDRVTATYLRLLERNLPALIAGSAPRRKQDHSRSTYTCRRLPSDNQIDWHAPTKNIFDLVRAVGVPYAGAYTWLQGKKLTIWKAEMLPSQRNYIGRVPGRVVEVRPKTGAVVLTADGTILVTDVQLEGGAPVCAAEALNGLSLTLGR